MNRIYRDAWRATAAHSVRFEVGGNMRLKRALALVLALAMMAGNTTELMAMEAPVSVEDAVEQTTISGEEYSETEPETEMTSETSTEVTSEEETETVSGSESSEAEETLTVEEPSSEEEVLIPAGVDEGRVVVYIATGVDGDDSRSKVIEYNNLADATAYIDAVRNNTARYIIEIKENISEDEITFPVNTVGVTYVSGARSAGDDEEPVEITYDSDITLKTDIELKNVVLVPANDSSKPAVNLGEFDFTINNNVGGRLDYKAKAVTGTTGSLILAADGAGNRTSLTVDNSIVISGDLSLDNAEITAGKTIEVENIASLSAGNRISFGAEDEQAKLSIKGSVDTGIGSVDYYAVSGDAGYSFESYETSVGKIKTNAIEVVNSHIYSGAPESNQNVAIAAKTDVSTLYASYSAGCFMPLKKVGDKLVTFDPLGDAQSPVTLIDVTDSNSMGSFENLYLALEELGNVGINSHEYEIDIKTVTASGTVDVTANKKDIAIPASIEKLTIKGVSDTVPTDVITLNKLITVTTHVEISNLILKAETGTLSVNIKSGSLSLDEVKLASGTSWGPVTTSEQINNSILKLVSGTYKFTKSVAVTRLFLGDGVEATMTGKNTFETIEASAQRDEDAPVLKVSGDITFDRNKIAKVVPYTTVTDDIDITDPYERVLGSGTYNYVPNIRFELCNSSGGALAVADDRAISAKFVPVIAGKNIGLSDNAAGEYVRMAIGSVEGIAVKKEGAIGYLKGDEEACVDLVYKDGAGNDIISNFTSIQDAVEEINSLRIRTDYRIVLKDGIENTPAAPIVMPAAKNYASLSIIGTRVADVRNTSTDATVYLTGALNFAGNVTVKDVDFVITKKGLTTPDLSVQYAVTPVNVTSGTLTIDDVTCNTAVIFDGKNVGSIRFTGDFEARPTCTPAGDIDPSPVNDKDDFVSVSMNGSILNMAKISIEDESRGIQGRRSCLEVISYENKAQNVFAAPQVTATTLYAKFAEVRVVESKAAIANGKDKYEANVKVAYLDLDDATLTVNGNFVATTSAALSGHRVDISADKVFNIKGTLHKNANIINLFTRVKDETTNAIPFLNISAKIEDNNPENDIRGHESELITVRVGFPIGLRQDEKYILGRQDVDKNGKTYNHTKTVLTAKNAEAGLFCVHADSLPDRTKSRLNNSEEALDGVSEGKNTSYYVLKKTGAVVEYMAASKVVAVVSHNSTDTEVSKSELVTMNPGNIVGYYATIGEASVDINNLADGKYTITLLRDTGNQKMPLPKKEVFINSYGEAKKFEYAAALTLKNNLTFDNIILTPAKAGLALNVKTFDLAVIGNCKSSGKALGTITGTDLKHSTVTLASQDFTVAGISKVAELAIGDITYSKGAINVGTITGLDSVSANLKCNASAQKITTKSIRGFSSDSSKKLKIDCYAGKLNVTGANMTGVMMENVNVNLAIPSGKTAEKHYKLIRKNNSVAFKGKEMLFLKGRYDAATVEFTIGGSTVNYPVKAAGALYYGDRDTIQGNAATLNVDTVIGGGPVSFSQRYLDVAQATADIAAWKDVNADYVIDLEAGAIDVVVTDKTKFSALKLPNAKAKPLYKSLSIVGQGVTGGTVTTLYSTGAINAYGDVCFKDMKLSSVNSKDKAVGASLNAFNSKGKSDSVIRLINCDAIFATFKGAKTTDVVLNDDSRDWNYQVYSDTSMRVNVYKELSGVDEIIIDNAKLTTWDKFTAASVVLKGNAVDPADGDTGRRGAGWDAIGKTTVGTITSDQSVNTYIGSLPTYNTKTKKWINNLTITKKIMSPVIVRLVDKDNSTIAKHIYTHIDKLSASSYIDKPLLKANRAAADMFVIWPYAGISGGTITNGSPTYDCYKDSLGTVFCGSLSSMEVLVTDGDGNESYAKNLYEAFRIIDVAGINRGEYTLTLRAGTGDSVAGGYKAYYTGKTGNLGAIGLPTKAEKITINTDDTNPCVVLYTGKLSNNVNLTFDGVSVSEARKSGDDADVLGKITPVIGAGKSLGFANGAGSCGTDSSVVYATTIDAKTGKIELDSASVYAKTKIDVAGIIVDGTSSVECNGPIAIGTGGIQGSGSLAMSDKTTAKVFAQSTTQLSLTGGVDSGVSVYLRPYIYSSGVYVAADESDVDEYIYKPSEKATPDAFMKLMTAKGAVCDNITVQYSADGTSWSDYSGGKLIKFNKGIYITDEEPVIAVTDIDNGMATESFYSWAQAVKAIDAYGNTKGNYRMELLANVGEDAGEIAPIAGLALPKKAASVEITGKLDASDDPEEYKTIFTTADKITLNTSLVMKGASIVTVKNISDAFQAVDGTIELNGHKLLLKDVRSVYELGMSEESGSAYAVTGLKKAGESLEIQAVSHTETRGFVKSAQNVASVSCGVYNAESATDRVSISIPGGISKTDLLVVKPFAYVDMAGANLNIKNLDMSETQLSGGEYVPGAVHAANIAVTGKSTLARSEIIAGTDLVGSGKLTLNNIVVAGKYNSVANGDDMSIFLIGKQDNEGKSLVTVKGKITTPIDVRKKAGNEELDAIIAAGTENYTDGIITVGLYYNNGNPGADSRMAQLSDGMVLACAPFIPTGYVRPMYSDGVSLNMGRDIELDAYEYVDGAWVTNRKFHPYGLVRKGDNLVYTRVAGIKNEGYDEDARLVSTELIIGTSDSSLRNSGEYLHEVCDTYADAINQIERIGNAKGEYTILLNSNELVQFKNAKGQYVPVTLPKAAAKLTINGGAVFALNKLALTCDLMIENMSLCTLAKNGVDADLDVDLAGHKFTLKTDNSNGPDGMYNINSVTSKNKKGSLLIDSSYWIDVPGNRQGYNVTSVSVGTARDFESLEVGPGCILRATGDVKVNTLKLTGDEKPNLADGSVTDTFIPTFIQRGATTVDKLVVEGSEAVIQKTKLGNALTVNLAVRFKGISPSEVLTIDIPTGSPLGAILLNSKKAATFGSGQIKATMGFRDYSTCVSGENIVLSTLSSN